MFDKGSYTHSTRKSRSLTANFWQKFAVIARLLQVEWVWKKEIGQIDLHVVKVNLTKAQSRKSKKSKFWGANFNKERI